MANCARRSSVYAFFIIVIACAQFIAPSASAKDGKEDRSLSFSGVTAIKATEFQWKEHNTLSWEDFKGPVNAASNESAAATHCGIGFKVNGANTTGRPEIVVYNTFYVNRSWVRTDAKITSILAHEQGHFDLCEIYTRKLRQMMTQFSFNVVDTRSALMAMFTQVNEEYERRQQAYEAETTHGTNLAQQQHWQDMIKLELN